MARSDFWSLLLLFAVCDAVQIPPACQVETTAGYRYTKFFVLANGYRRNLELHFQVMATGNAHIALTASPIAQNPLYEIVIGASGNNFTDMRRSMTGRSVNAVRTPSVLSDAEYRGFWISWRAGELEIGLQGEMLPFFYYNDPEPLPVHYYSLSSWTNSVAKWIHQCNFSEAADATAAPGGAGSDAAAPASASAAVLAAPEDRFNFSAEEKLRVTLLETYFKVVRPLSDAKQPLTVAVSMALTHIDLNEMDSHFVVHCWYRMSWRDDRLRWNTSEYDELPMIHMPGYDIWLPDITLYNAAEANEVLHFPDAPVRVYADGSVLWLPSATFNVRCRFDVRRWPFDAQTCTLRMGSSTHDGQYIDLVIYNNETEVEVKDVFLENTGWRLVGSESQIQWQAYGFYPERHPEAQFTFRVVRNAPLLRTVYVVTAFAIVCLTTASLLLPTAEREKTLVGAANLVVTVFCLTFFVQIVPAVGGATPLLVLFYSQSLAVSVVSTTLNAALAVIARRCGQRGTPYCISRFLYGSTGWLCGFPKALRSSGGATDGVEDHRMRYVSQINGAETDGVDEAHADTGDLVKVGGVATPAHHEWLLLAGAVDRLLCLVYGVTTVSLMALQS